jgi:hypothetical protein
MKKNSARPQGIQAIPAYSALCRIPESIIQAATNEGIGACAYAFACQCALIFRILLALCWRFSVLRGCMITGPRPSVFKACLSPMEAESAPNWVMEVLAANPDAMFWQFKFEGHLKSRFVQGIFPQQLSSLLEEFLAVHRPLLVGIGNDDPGTLLVTRKGRAFSNRGFRELIHLLTGRFFGNRVSGQGFRRAFAIAWLRANQDDYLTLARILWIRKVERTIQLYFTPRSNIDILPKLEGWMKHNSK